MTRKFMICWALIIAGGFIVGCEARQAARQAASEATVTQIGMAFQPVQDKAEGAVTGFPSAIDRKIIYEAAIHLVVRDFSGMENAVSTLVKEHGGYLANVSIDRTSGERRSGRWQARIPVDQFESFMDAASELGMAESRSQTAQDVTEEYVDLEARITNKKRLEERILKLLEETDSKIKDVIEVERELARVRGEIEQMEGRLRYLTNRTQLTTVTIIAREQRDYVPPEAPTFLARIRQAWGNSLFSLRQFCEAAGVAIVFAVPWLLVLAIVAGPPVWYMRRSKVTHKTGAKNEPPQSSASPDQPDG